MNEKSHIASVADVKAFFHHLVDERKLNFPPDDDFADYICVDDGTPLFTDDEVVLYKRLMEESFDKLCSLSECHAGYKVCALLSVLLVCPVNGNAEFADCCISCGVHCRISDKPSD